MEEQTRDEILSNLIASFNDSNRQQKKPIMEKIKTWLTMAMIILSLMGLVTFSLFICEEAIQTTMFGTWPAQDAGDWHHVKRGTDLIAKINTTMKIINYSAGWIQPLAFISYKRYSESADYYLEGLKSKVFARCPECFEGEKIRFTFTPLQAEYTDEGARLSHGAFSVVMTKMPVPPLIAREVYGTVEISDGRVIVRSEQ